MKISSDHKMVVILDESLPLGLKANTAGVLSLTLGNKIEGLIGHDLIDKSDITHTALTKYPLPILAVASEKLKDIYRHAFDLKDDLLLVDVTDAAQTTKNYEDYERKLKEHTIDELTFLGIALSGDKKIINKLTGNLPLLR